LFLSWHENEVDLAVSGSDGTIAELDCSLKIIYKSKLPKGERKKQEGFLWQPRLKAKIESIRGKGALCCDSAGYDWQYTPFMTETCRYELIELIELI